MSNAPPTNPVAFQFWLSREIGRGRARHLPGHGPLDVMPGRRRPQPAAEHNAVFALSGAVSKRISLGIADGQPFLGLQHHDYRGLTALPWRRLTILDRRQRGGGIVLELFTAPERVAGSLTLHLPVLPSMLLTSPAILEAQTVDLRRISVESGRISVSQLVGQRIPLTFHSA